MNRAKVCAGISAAQLRATHGRTNIGNVNAQFEFIPVVPDDASGDVSACPA